MTNTLYIVLGAFFIFSEHVTAQVPNKSCGVNEQWSECPSSCGSLCPTSEDDVKRCVNDQCDDAKCECLFNHKRLSNGTCVPTTECPPFECSRPNERFDPCPPLCPSDDCSQATPDGHCPPLIGQIRLVLTCEPKCRCVVGFWRKNGVCVPYDQC